MPISHRTTVSASKASDSSPWGELLLRLERCEDRLVLSAIPILDISHHLFEQAPEPSVLSSVGEFEPFNPTVGPVVDRPVEPFASAAHNQTGWTDVQRWFGLRGERQTVAVIDSGIAWDHVALGRGYGPGYRVVGGWDFAENDSRPYDDAPAGFHGTHVAGIVGADDPARSGVAPGVDLVALRVFDDSGKGQLAWAESALRWVHQNRAAFASPITTVNLSLGSTWNSDSVPSWGTLEDELMQLQQDGIVVVASAGNSFKQYSSPGLSYPAASPYVIPVASVDANGQLSDFSQRHERVIAAPGRQITSTVPDHVFGTDGVVNDWSIANGTSMAAPYVAGSAVLIREAMEMVGRASITPQEIYQWMSDTADSVWDSVTKTTYERLNLSRAISSLLPIDNIGDSWNDAQSIQLQSSFTTNSWLNTLGDRDVFRFTAASDGTLSAAIQSPWIQDIEWTLWVDGKEVPMDDPSGLNLKLEAGRSYAFAVSDDDQIGSYGIQWNFSSSKPSSHDGEASGNNGQGTIGTDLGSIDYRELTSNSGGIYSLQASRDGMLSIIVEADQAKTGFLEVRNAQGQVLRDSTVEDGQWRIDVETTQGSKWTVQTPKTNGEASPLILANILQRSDSTLSVFGTQNSDSLEVDLHQGLRLQFEKIDYRFAESAIKDVRIDLGSGSDSISVRGSGYAEKIDLRPDHSNIENQQVAIDLRSSEQIDYSGGGGSDRVYLYGSTGDDALTARPRDVELVGAGFRFHVDDVERTYVNAEQGGQDIAYFYDSIGDDRLSVRPQFSSMSGKDFFNYASGMERVYAYSNAGGIDAAILYDSSADDTFFTSGDVASIVGTGFFSYTRYFENVEAVSATGGKDNASIYTSERNAILVGSDFTGYQDGSWSRIARGFSSAKMFVDNQLIETKLLELDVSSAPMPVSVSSIVGVIIDPSGATEQQSRNDTDLHVSPLSTPPTSDLSQPNEDANPHFITLDDSPESKFTDEFEWIDLQHERRLLDEIFAERL